ncbi:hypothetical protein OEV98_02415 [Caldibacillus lycopersici]|uniref:Uncharacterized protein n=1 Tax=Perspicuibacillus lycopersici TaxID=1325689 RepID=A0AAE3LLJ4_9BACI|nr:hypothetical protein [Perspicuibacillus lycopersici]MCU9612415.1 hypothetical protein [Perspicuibacillus lycopersici]
MGYLLPIDYFQYMVYRTPDNYMKNEPENVNCVQKSNNSQLANHQREAHIISYKRDKPTIEFAKPLELGKGIYIDYYI